MKKNILRRFLEWLDSICDPVKVFWELRFSGIKILIKGDHFMAELEEGQTMTAKAVLKTSAGKPAAYEKGSAQWTSSDENVASVTVNPENELEATVEGIDGSNNGSALIEFRVDGDPDADETREIILTGSVTVTQGEAVTGELEFGTPVDPTPGEVPA